MYRNHGWLHYVFRLKNKYGHGIVKRGIKVFIYHTGVSVSEGVSVFEGVSETEGVSVSEWVSVSEQEGGLGIQTFR